jgi:hypothetical protein
MAYKAPPFYSGHYGRMADLSLQRGQQEAEAIRQTWGAVGNVLPSTIGQIQQYQKDEQQRQYYDTVGKRQQFAHDVEIRDRINTNTADQLIFDSGGDATKAIGLANDFTDPDAGHGVYDKSAVSRLLRAREREQLTEETDDWKKRAEISGYLTDKYAPEIHRMLNKPAGGDDVRLFTAYEGWLNGEGGSPGALDEFNEAGAALRDDTFSKILPKMTYEEFMTVGEDGVTQGRRSLENLLTRSQTLQQSIETQKQDYALASALAIAGETPVADMNLPDQEKYYQTARDVLLREIIGTSNDDELQAVFENFTTKYADTGNGAWVVEKLKQELPIAERNTDGSVQMFHPSTGVAPDSQSFEISQRNWRRDVATLRSGEDAIGSLTLTPSQSVAMRLGLDGIPSRTSPHFFRYLQGLREAGLTAEYEAWTKATDEFFEHTPSGRTQQLTPTGIAAQTTRTNNLIREDNTSLGLMKALGTGEGNNEDRFLYLTGQRLLGQDDVVPITINPEILNRHLGDAWTEQDVVDMTDEAWAALIDDASLFRREEQLRSERELINLPPEKQVMELFSDYLSEVSRGEEFMQYHSGIDYSDLPESERERHWQQFQDAIIEDKMLDDLGLGVEIEDRNWRQLGPYLDRYNRVMGDTPFYLTDEFSRIMNGFKR